MVYGNLQGYFNAITCAINGTSISSCAYPNLGYSYNNYGIAIANNYAYITAASNNLIICSVNGTSFSGCHASSSYGLSGPYGIAITPSGAYVFIVNSSNSSVSSCSISSGALSNCSNAGG